MLKKLVIAGWTAFTILLLIIVFVSPTFADDPRPNDGPTLYSSSSSGCCGQTDARSTLPNCCETEASIQSYLPSCCR